MAVLRATQAAEFDHGWQRAVARRLKVSPATISTDIDALREQRKIRSIEVVADAAALGVPLLAFLIVLRKSGAATSAAQFELALRRDKLVLEIHDLRDIEAFLLRVRARDDRDLRAQVRRIRRIDGVANVQSHVVLETARETVRIETSEAAA